MVLPPQYKLLHTSAVGFNARASFTKPNFLIISSFGARADVRACGLAVRLQGPKAAAAGVQQLTVEVGTARLVFETGKMGRQVRRPLWGRSSQAGVRAARVAVVVLRHVFQRVPKTGLLELGKKKSNPHFSSCFDFC